MSADDHDHHHGQEHHHGDDREERRRRRERPSASAWITNWNEYDASTGTKLALAARNLFIGRWKNALTCCGHPGQPGC